MRLPQRDRVLFLVVSVTICVAMLVEPDWHLQEAHRYCDGQPVEVHESMTACAVGQPVGCLCARPENPWAVVFWLAILSGVGVTGAFLLRSPPLIGAALVACAVVVGGYGGLWLQSRRTLFEPEAWGYAPIVFGICISITLASFGLTRLAFRFLSTRQRAT